MLFNKTDSDRKIRYCSEIHILLLIIISLLLTACSSISPETTSLSSSDFFNSGEMMGRFERAEKYGQFVPVGKSVDCKGTKVTIDKVLMDKTHTFMIATVDGDIKGRMDYLTVDLFDGQGKELGRSTFLQKLTDGKTLLTFDPVQGAPEALRMEFFGGPVGYSGHVILSLDNIDFKIVDEKYTKKYLLSETLEKKGFRLVVDSLECGISEIGVLYKLSSLGDYDGIKHGWLYDWNNNFSPEGDILSIQNNGHKLGMHQSSINTSGPYYRVSQDRKSMVGRAYFDSLEASSLQIKLTDIYGYYRMNEIISIDGVNDKLEINKKIRIKNYVLNINSFYKGNDKDAWILDYDVVDSSGNKIDAAIEAGIYMKSDNYQMPLTFMHIFKDIESGDKNLLFNWQPPDNRDSIISEPAIKITALGIRQEDAVIDINLAEPKKAEANPEEVKIIAAINDYYNAFASALKSGDSSVFEQKYGYLKPTSQKWDGVNMWRQHFQSWKSLGAKEYSFSFKDPIINISGNKATADLNGIEKIVHNSGESGAGFGIVIYLEKSEDKWKITKIDEVTDGELHGM